MKVNVMHIRSANRLLLEVNEWLVIEVNNFGSENYSWNVKLSDVQDGRDPQKTLEEVFGPMCDGWGAAQSLGIGAIWFEPVTFAHAVMDVIQNQ